MVILLLRQRACLLGHLASGRRTAVLDPARPAHRTNARRLLQVREVLLRDSSQNEVRNIRAADRPGLVDSVFHP